MKREELTSDGIMRAVAWIQQAEQSAPVSRRSSLAACLRQLTDLKDCLERGEIPKADTCAEALAVVALAAQLERSSLATPAATALQERTGQEVLRRIAQHRSDLDAAEDQDSGQRQQPEADAQSVSQAVPRFHARLRAYLERRIQKAASSTDGDTDARPDQDWSIRTNGEPEATEVVCTTSMRLIVSSASSLPVPAEFRYRPADPYAIEVTFHTGAEETVQWVLARETVAAGMRTRSGVGDVRIWPSQKSGTKSVCISLHSPEGIAVLEASWGALQTFLRHTNSLVPPGTEGQRVDIDKAFDLTLRGATGPGADKDRPAKEKRPHPASKVRKPTK